MHVSSNDYYWATKVYDLFLEVGILMIEPSGTIALLILSNYISNVWIAF